MGSLMQDFKKQASFFLKEKIKTARLAFLDVTPAQILTEEITNGDSLAQDAHAMRLISRAAFEVDDYDRIVQILHHRLSKFDTWNWKASYMALVVLEHLLTHGPQRVVEEFENDQQIIRDMATSFHYVDVKGFNWGLSVKNKSERIISLLDDKSYLKEERAKARKLSFGIKGFGSFNESPLQDKSFKQASLYKVYRSKSLFFNKDYYGTNDKNLLGFDEHDKLLVTLTGQATENLLKGWSQTYSSNEIMMEKEHPFWDKEPQTRVSLLSSI